MLPGLKPTLGLITPKSGGGGALYRYIRLSYTGAPWIEYFTMASGLAGAGRYNPAGETRTESGAEPMFKASHTLADSTTAWYPSMGAPAWIQTNYPAGSEVTTGEYPYLFIDQPTSPGFRGGTLTITGSADGVVWDTLYTGAAALGRKSYDLVNGVRL